MIYAEAHVSQWQSWSLSLQSLRAPCWSSGLKRASGWVPPLRRSRSRSAKWGLDDNTAWYGQEKLWVNITVCLCLPVSVCPSHVSQKVQPFPRIKLWKLYFYKEVLWSYFILLYGCTTWTLTKRLEKKIDGNYTRMLRAILNKSWQQHPTRHQLYGHLPPITKTIQVRRTRHAGHCWRSWDELISDVLLWTPTYGRAKARRPARTYIQQLCEDTGCSPEELPEAMNDREKWRERVRDIRSNGTTWWWWWWWYSLIMAIEHFNQIL